MVALVATYNNINNNKIYLLNITVDGEKVETGSRLKVAWFNWIGRIGRNEQGFFTAFATVQLPDMQSGDPT